MSGHESMGSDGALLKASGGGQFALMPLSDDLIDFLLEHNPKLIAECDRIRQQMRAGRFKSHAEVKKLLRELGE
jgi:hypothetical protein